MIFLSHFCCNIKGRVPIYKALLFRLTVSAVPIIQGREPPVYHKVSTGGAICISFHSLIVSLLRESKLCGCAGAPRALYMCAEHARALSTSKACLLAEGAEREKADKNLSQRLCNAHGSLEVATLANRPSL
jgi:hypothetical protein